MIYDSGRIAWVQHATNVALGAAFEVPVSPDYAKPMPKLSAGSNEPQPYCRADKRGRVWIFSGKRAPWLEGA